jgi:hypothetical protein
MKKLNKVLENILMEQPEGIIPSIPELGTGYDIAVDSETNMRKDVLSPAYTYHPNMDSDTEPADKILIQIIDYFMRGEFSKANMLIKSCRDLRNGTFFSWYQMNQLIDWVRNVHKYTNMGSPNDLSRNYYQYQCDKDKEILGVSDLTKVPVGEVMVDKFVKDVENVLRRNTD